MDVNVEAERARAGRPIRPDEVDSLESLGALLQSYRERAGMSRRQLADATGYVYNCVSFVEQGCRRTRPSTLRHFADALVIACPDLGTAEDVHARLVAAAGTVLANEPRNLQRYEARRARRSVLRQTAKERDAALEEARLRRVEQARARAHWRWIRANRGH